MNGWKDYFHFQKIERQGLFILIGFIVFILVVINFLSYHEQSGKQDFSDFQEKINAFEASVKEEKKVEKSMAIEEEGETKKLDLFNFDPNQLPVSEWVKLGLSEKQAEVIKNYERSGGTFKVKEDVKKMYTINTETFEQLEPYIQLPDKIAYEEEPEVEKEDYNTKKYKSYTEKGEVYLDLNRTDSLSLTKLSGIGPSFSSRIVKYRKLLGGFHSKEQLKEVWGLDSVLYAKIDPYLSIKEPVEIQKISINSASAEVLKNHPYIDWNVANSIEKYREQNGKYQTLEEIKKSHLIDDSIYRKIAPYLTVEE